MMIETVKTDKETCDRMCWLLRKEIGKNAQSGAKHWLAEAGHGKIDREMWDMTVNDTEDLICIHNLIEEGEIPLAFESASNLDTAVRDVIPAEVWNWMSTVHAAWK